MLCINMRSSATGRLFLAVLTRTTTAIALSLQVSVSHSHVLDQTIKMSLGQQGAEIVKQSLVPIEQSGVKGSRMYEVGRYVNRIEPVVVLNDDDHSITFPVAEKVVFYDDGTTGGVDEILIDVRLPEIPQHFVDIWVMADHHEAVLKIAQNTIDQINQALWQRRIMLDRPRPSGRGTIAFMGNYRNGGHAVAGQNTWGIDPSYRMTADEWANLADTLHRWRWIKNGALITMHYERNTWQAAGRQHFFEKLSVNIQSANPTSFKVHDLRIPPDNAI